MGLHLELSGDLTDAELAGVEAMIAVLRRGARGLALPFASSDMSVSGTVIVPEAKPAEPSREVPKPPESAGGATPPPPVTNSAAGASIPPPPGGDAPLIDPAAEVIPPPPPPPVGDLDANGLPWDIRIHASTKSQKADKTWTAKRNVAADLVTQVEAELRQNLAAAGTPGPNDDKPVYTDPAQAFGTTPPPPPPETGTTTPPPPPPETGTTTPPPPPTDNAGGMAEFARIMRVVVDKQKAGTLSTELASGIARQLGLADMRGLATRLDLIPAFEALLP